MKISEKSMAKIVIFLYNFSNSLLEAIVRLFFLKKENFRNVNSIIIFRNGNIGDIVCSIPAIYAVRNNFPEAKIILLSSPGERARKGANDILAGEASLTNIITYYSEDIASLRGMSKLIRTLRKEKFDLFIELPQDLAKMRTLIRDIIFAKLIGVKYAIGFQLNTIRIGRQLQSRYFNFCNEQSRLISIIEKEGIVVAKHEHAITAPNEDNLKSLESTIEFNTRRIIIINPNAQRQTNRWPLERFAEVGKHILSRYDVEIFILGGEDDAKRSEYLRQLIGDKVINIAGKFSIVQVAEIIRKCMLVISNDTGIIHIAANFNKPLIGIYSGRDIRGKWYPAGQNNIIFRKEPGCHTCYKNFCDHLTCLKMISVGEVLKASDDMLEQICGKKYVN